MNLSKISTRVRPRNSWEALDLGMLMALRWYGPLLRGWLLPTLPLFALLMVLPHGYAFLPIWIIWWFVPWWEKTQLQYLGHRLFGEHLNLGSQMRFWLQSLKKDGLSSITWRRFNPHRPYVLPVTQLEGLAGSSRRNRLKLFDGPNQHAAAWLLFVAQIVMLILVMASYWGMYFLVPAGSPLEEQFAESMLDMPILLNILLYGAMTLVSPFVTAGAFSLYLNQRTQIEGWDIEITFRRMMERQQKPHTSAMASILTCGLLLIFTLHGTPVSATDLKPVTEMAADIEREIESQEETKEEIKAEPLNLTPAQLEVRSQARQVLQGDDFGKKQVKEELVIKSRFADDDEDTDIPKAHEPSRTLDGIGKVLEFLANSIEVILTGLVIAIALLITWRYRHWIARISKVEQSTNKTTPKTLFGMAIDKESLPDDPAAAARQLWQQGQNRQALSLLYRACLHQLVHEHQMDIHESFTEGECLSHVKALAPAPLAEYFAQLTGNWQRLAYAQIPPGSEQMLPLIDRWSEHFPEVKHD